MVGYGLLLLSGVCFFINICFRFFPVFCVYRRRWVKIEDFCTKAIVSWFPRIFEKCCFLSNKNNSIKTSTLTKQRYKKTLHFPEIYDQMSQKLSSLYLTQQHLFKLHSNSYTKMMCVSWVAASLKQDIKTKVTSLIFLSSFLVVGRECI